MTFLLMGGFMIAKAMMVNGMDKRIAYDIMSMKRVGDNPWYIFLAIGLACMLYSDWISNAATAVMVFPIALGLLEAIRKMTAAQSKVANLSLCRYATGLMLMATYVCSIDGVLTPIGTPPNIIMLGFLSRMCDLHVSFLQWMVRRFVTMATCFAVTYIALSHMFLSGVKRIADAIEFTNGKVKTLGEQTCAQKGTMIAFDVAVIFWITPGVPSIVLGIQSDVLNRYNKLFLEAIVAIVGTLLLLLLPVDLEKNKMTLDRKDAMASMEWDVLLLFGGGPVMGGMMYPIGLSSWIGDQIIAMMGGKSSELLFVAVFYVISLLLSGLTSRTTATNMTGPLAIGAALSAGFSPVPMAVGVALSASLGFILPVSTPPSAIVYASGHVPITKMIKSGIHIDFVGTAIVTIPVALYLVSMVVGQASYKHKRKRPYPSHTTGYGLFDTLSMNTIQRVEVPSKP